jgi:tellurite resistance protein TerC
MESVGTPALWIGFTIFVLAMLTLDLGVFHRKSHVVSFKEAAGWSVVWIAVSLAFGGGVWWLFGQDMGMQYLTGYIIEKALSVDNIFVMLVIMNFFVVPREYQHKVLFWGILGALVMRAGFIFAGAALIQKFHWVMYLFGLVLVWTGVKLFRNDDEAPDPSKNKILKLFKRYFPTTSEYHGDRFFIVEAGKRLATPLMIVLVTVEATDLVFAVDSIPAIFAVSRDPFIVYTSNIFAILGLRSLFFLLSGVLGKFHYLKYGLALVLLFVGGKMLVSGFFHMPTWISLVVVTALIGGSVLVSLFKPPAPVEVPTGTTTGEKTGSTTEPKVLAKEHT